MEGVEAKVSENKSCLSCLPDVVPYLFLCINVLKDVFFPFFL